MTFRVRTKAIVAGAVLSVVLLLVLLFVLDRRRPQDITIRHVKSVQSEDITIMTFEIKNHTSNSYIFALFELEVRKGNGWNRFPGLNTRFSPVPNLDPGGLATYSVSVTNLPAGSLVRFSIHPMKIILGFSGFVRRAQFNFQRLRRGGGGMRISLNPNDKNSKVYGSTTEVVSEEFVEQGPEPTPRMNSEK